MKLNRQYSQNEKEVLLDKEKKQIEELKKTQQKDYEEKIQTEPTYDNILTFSSIPKNLINWYPFKEGASVLQIGSDYGALTEELCKKAKRVVLWEESSQKAEAIGKRLQEQENLELMVGDYKRTDWLEKFD